MSRRRHHNEESKSGLRVGADSLQGSAYSVRVHSDSQDENDSLAVDQDLDLSQFKVVPVTERNKELLLGNASKAAQDLLPETQAVFARLEQLHPPTAKELELKPLALSEAPFRLLSDLPESSLYKSQIQFDSFIALSYCWHSDEWDPTEGGSKMNEWPISSAMMRALLKERQSPSEGVWVDACCIDQDNEIEKVHAIGSMDVIYKSARLVVVVLEDVRLSDSEKDMLAKFLANDEYSPILDTPREDLRTLFSILDQIFRARWFTRAWCSHELQLSSNSMYFLSTNEGILRFTPLDLDRLYRITYSISKEDANYRRTKQGFRKNQAILNRRACGAPSVDGSRNTFMSQCNTVWQLDASIEIDKIGIALNIAGLQMYFKGRRKSHDECRWVLAMVALSAGDVTVLGGIDSALRLDLATGATSWLHWSKDHEDRIAAYNGTKVAEQCIKLVDYNRIVLDLFVLKGSAVRLPSTSSVREATIFVDHCIVEQPFNSRRSWMSWCLDSAELEKSRSWAIETTACSLDCGISWIMKQTLKPKILRCYKIRKQEFWLLVRDLLTSRHPSESATIENLARKDREHLLVYFAFVLIYLHRERRNRSKYSSGMHRDLDGHEFLPQSMRVEMGGVARGITISGLGNMQRYVLAIPVAMSGASCARTRRLWLLRPSETASDGSWKIVDKVRFVTFEPITEDWAGIERCNEQTIRGS